MPHVITQPCCNDASCVPVCPVGCIHPTPDEPGFASAEALYIDPASCIDCGACVAECPVGAITRDTAPAAARFLDLAEAYYQRNPLPPGIPAAPPPAARAEVEELRVAVVGSGPAGAYAALELLEHPGATVTMFDRLPTPWGLVRGGVAPDHPSTKSVTEVFERAAANGRFRFHLNVEVGTHITHDELAAAHHAVVYAYGASGDRRLGIPGEDLPGSASATEFVNWYNGHPDFVDRTFDLSCRRAIVVGNGNVALDIARLLAADPAELAATDMADHALAALAASAIEEVLVLGRRGPAQAAYTTPELLALTDLDGADVFAFSDEVTLDADQLAALQSDPLELAKAKAAAELAARRRGASRRIVLRYLGSPLEIMGDERVTGVRVARNRLERGPGGDVRAVPTGIEETIEAGLVLRAVGYRGAALSGLPFDPDRGVLPNHQGRVLHDRTGEPIPGVYTAGWIKRGPSGGIGANKKCALDTVAALVADHSAGLLPTPAATPQDLDTLVRNRQPAVVGVHGWRAIDRTERELGAVQGRPRRKLASFPALLAAAHGDDSMPTIPLPVDADRIRP
ncbi:FAD-dependent oxidoreductase [Nocardia sp. NBC_00508]|uniref:FAD-dependent oxidoreductase n=1 Tax=Nocardia sp. NBC_00508 TaxID=2975992 RepID=UPI002E807A47|nr:FAD-dependent oxidoreductase [Nocardia sp. NBC_00508]WUD67843.1 FAD-dependent oxidoreductase [Nocardia sp. NBC_00508]